MKYPILIVVSFLTVFGITYATVSRKKTEGPVRRTVTLPASKALKRDPQIILLQSLMRARFANTKDEVFGMGRIPGLEPFHNASKQMPNGKAIMASLPSPTDRESKLYKEIKKRYGALSMVGVGRADTQTHIYSIKGPSPRVRLGYGTTYLSVIYKTQESQDAVEEWSRNHPYRQDPGSGAPTLKYAFNDFGLLVRDVGTRALKEKAPLHVQKSGIHFDADLIFATEKKCYSCHPGVKKGEPIGAVVFAYGDLSPKKLGFIGTE